MKTSLIGSFVAFLLASTAASAGNLPVKAPPPAPPRAANWSGCYVDAGVGYGMWTQDHSAITDPGSATLTPTPTTGGEGWLGRVGGGCDYQFALPKLGNFVVGAFADYDFASLSGTFQESLVGTVGNEKETGAWSVGARAGYLVTPNLLAYLDAGYTQARFGQIGLFTDTIPSVATPFAIGANTYNGWFLGSGAEYFLQRLPGLFWRSEYRYASYGSADIPIVFTPTGALTGVGMHTDKQVQTVTTGLVYKFNWAGIPGTASAGGTSLAGGLPVKAPPRPAPPVSNWTGCYVGAGVGYGMWTQSHYGETDPGFIQETPSATTGGNGWLGRAGGGCDYQVAVGNLGHFVVGVLGDYDLASVAGTFQDTLSGFLGTERESAAFAVGARAGYLATPSLLTYVDGGYSQARFQQIGLGTDTIPSVATIFSVPANTYRGWFVGGGAEYALNMNWIPVHGLFWRTEYRYASYAAADVPIQPLAVTGSAENMQKNVETATTSLIWRFNWPGGWHQ